MLYREVPKNGDKLSVLGYGCMRLPAKMNSINQKLAEKQILYDVSFPERRPGYGKEDNGLCVCRMRTMFGEVPPAPSHT